MHCVRRPGSTLVPVEALRELREELSRSRVPYSSESETSYIWLLDTNGNVELDSTCRLGDLRLRYVLLLGNMDLQHSGPEASVGVGEDAWSVESVAGDQEDTKSKL